MDLNDLVYIDATGYHYADYPSFLQWRQEQVQAIYGADIYIEPDSQDGQLLAVQAKADYDTAAKGSSNYNSFSPATAQGVGLSRNVKINGLSRLIPSYSTVELEVVGTTDTVITNGVAQDSLGQKWLLPVTVTIPGGGSVTVTATAELVGAINAGADTVNIIFTPTLGWQTVNNDNAATPGAAVESDAELRLRQAQSTANPSQTVLDGTTGAVANLTGVTKVKSYENDTGITDGNGIPAHSICVVVAGGDNQEIGDAITVHKTPGTRTFGDTDVDTFDAHGMPLVIHFQRADPATIAAVVTISVNEGWSNDYIDLIEAAVAAVLNAGEIGKTILLTKLYAPAYLTGTPASSTFDIASIEIGKDGSPPAGTNIVLDFDEDPVCDPDVDVTVVVS